MSSNGVSQWRHIGLFGHSVGTFTAEPTTIQWRSKTTSKIAQAANLTSATFTQFGPTGHLVVHQSTPSNNHDANTLRFDGFRPSDFEKLRDLFEKNYDISISRKSYCSSGASFGVTDLQSSKKLVFLESIIDRVNDEDADDDEMEETTGEEMLSLNLNQVSQCVLPGTNRNEIEMQFHESDAVIENGDATDQLVQIRFYVPPHEEHAMNKEDKTPAEFLQEKIMDAARIQASSGSLVCEFVQEQGTFLTPRGRYAIQLYDSFLRLRGAKYDYKIQYADLSRLFLLPKPDDIHFAFVIALDKPIRQGQQRYQYLILQTTREQASVSIQNVENYEGELQEEMAGSLSNLIAKTFKVITKKKVFIPGKFQAVSNSAKCVKCALKANEGLLYPLEKQFVFIHKPAVLIRFEEVESVEFQRYAGGSGSTRNFDLCVTLKDRSSSYTFSGIDRADYNSLYSFISQKKMRIKNLSKQNLDGDGGNGSNRRPVYNEDEIFGRGAAGDDGESSEEDEDYDANAQASSSSEDISDEDSDDGDDDVDSDLEQYRKHSANKSRSSGGKKPSSSSTKSNSNKKRTSADVEEDQSPKKKKAKKDPNAPKRSMSAYMIFSNEKREEIKKANPDAGFGETQKLIAAEWSKLDDNDKKSYNDEAAKEKGRYEREMKLYKSNLPEDDEGTSKQSSKKKKDPNAPKRAISSYMFFMKEERAGIKAANPDVSFAELSKLIGARFKSLSEEERKKYDSMANEDKERYKVEMEKYNSSKKKEAASAAASDSSSDDSD